MKKLLVFLMCAATAALAGQSPPPSQSQADAQVQGPTFRTGIDVIAVDVAVMDDKGKPVEDLRAPDFLVKIDGVLRRVVSAEQVRVDVEAARRQAVDPFETTFTTNLTPPNGRLIVIAVDQSAIRIGAARRLLNSAAKFLDMLSPADRVAFVAYPEPGVAVDFTADRLRLKLAMERVVGTKSRFAGKFNIGLYEAIAIIEQRDDQIFMTVSGRECAGLRGQSLEDCEREALSEAETIVRTARQETRDSLRSLHNLLTQLAIVEGPKSLILLSEGLVLEHPGQLADVIQAAALARISIHVLLMDVPRDDITMRQVRPTAFEDRNLQEEGLQNLAVGARGALYTVIGTGEQIFERLSSELSAYYLLAVEQTPGDRDGGRHRIDVEVRRRNVTVRSRRAFVLSSPANRRQKPEEALIDALRAPFGVAEVPLRLTTFAHQDPDSAKVRLIIAAEVGQPGPASAEYLVGFALIDPGGTVVAGGTETRTLTAPNGVTTAPPDYLRELVVEPGTYSLRFGVVDASGRRGAVVREVNAWKLSGEAFALGDLLIGEIDAGAADRRLRPGVEPRVRAGRLGAVLEVYSNSAALLDQATVSFEIADDQDAPALVAGPAELRGGDATRRVAQATISPAWLPPGRYVARARVEREGRVAAVIARPFILDPPTTDASGTVLPPPGLIVGSVAKFDPPAVLAREVVGSMLDVVEQGAPTLKGALAEARAGRYAAAAVEALITGDQTAAAFLKGLDWYAKGQLDQAATQLQIAAGPRREFFPAAFYLGAALAAAGRDRDAAATWQLAMGREPRPPLVYVLCADARMRDGQPSSAVDVLKPAYERAPADDEIGRRLAMAYLMTGRYAEAVPVLDGYLSRQLADHDALFAAVFARYQLASRERLKLGAGDQAQLARYVRAYRGPQQALLAKYVDAMRSR